MGNSGQSVLHPRAGWPDSPCSEDHGRQQGREASLSGPLSPKFWAISWGAETGGPGSPGPLCTHCLWTLGAQTFLGWGPVKVSPVPGRPSQRQVFMTQDETLGFMSQDEAKRQEDTEPERCSRPPLFSSAFHVSSPSAAFHFIFLLASSRFLFFPFQSLHLLNMQ